jgi:hypothetical protein
MANAKSASKATLLQRQQVAEAVLQGFLDSAVAADLATAQSNGYKSNQTTEAEVGGIIAGVNR